MLVSFQVQKLYALGDTPILFTSHKDSKGKWVADVVTNLPKNKSITDFLNNMKTAYEFILKIKGKISFMQSSLLLSVNSSDEMYRI